LGTISIPNRDLMRLDTSCSLYIPSWNQYLWLGASQWELVGRAKHLLCLALLSHWCFSGLLNPLLDIAL
jgi:hypothetical protein